MSWKPISAPTLYGLYMAEHWQASIPYLHSYLYGFNLFYVQMMQIFELLAILIQFVLYCISSDPYLMCLHEYGTVLLHTYLLILR